MTDRSGHQVPAGSRDDLIIEAPRCLRIRFGESCCSHCCSICPKQAISLEERLEVDANLCTGCLLCTSVCPSGALELSADFPACLAQLSSAPEPVLGCCRTREQSHATLSCLGGLSDEHLLMLSHRLSPTLTLNLTRCSGCPNSTMLPLLQERLEILSRPGSGAGRCTIMPARSGADLHFREKTVDRRGFFKSFRSSLFRSAAVVLSAGSGQTEQRRDYTAKRVPVRRELLNRIAGSLDSAAGEAVRKRFEHLISFSDSCTKCQGCVAICPTGALRTDGETDSSPRFDPACCTGCGLCVEFCMDGALRLAKE